MGTSPVGTCPSCTPPAWWRNIWPHGAARPVRCVPHGVASPCAASGPYRPPARAQQQRRGDVEQAQYTLIPTETAALWTTPTSTGSRKTSTCWMSLLNSGADLACGSGGGRRGGGTVKAPLMSTSRTARNRWPCWHSRDRPRGISFSACSNGEACPSPAGAWPTIAGARVLIGRTGYTGASLSASSSSWTPSGVELAGSGPGRRRARGAGSPAPRLEAALPLYGNELGANPEGCEIPIMLPLAAFAVSFSPVKGEFVGRAALLRQHTSRLQADPGPRLRAQSRPATDDAEAWRVREGAWPWGGLGVFKDGRGGG